MAKFTKKNAQLKSVLGTSSTAERIRESQNVPDYDTVNLQGVPAYELDDKLKFISILNTIKVDNQFYRSEDETISVLRGLAEKLSLEDPYFVAQCIVYSRCVASGMRSVNHLAAVFIAPFISGLPWAKRFYGRWNKKLQKGGCIFRLDDMSQIKNVFATINKSPLTNSMKKGFASVLETADTYELSKYKQTVIDISNLVHPNVNKSEAKITIDGEEWFTLAAILSGKSLLAETWETKQSEAGQNVAKQVKEGKLTEDEAKEVLAKAMNDNWESMLSENKLGILAALRNINNMLKSPKDEIIDMLCNLVSNATLIREGLVMPYQIDLAYEAILINRGSENTRKLIKALETGLELATPNLATLLKGRNLVIIDCSGSMHRCIYDVRTKRGSHSSCLDKASLIAAMIAKSTNADIIRFGSRASYYNYNVNDSVFTIARGMRSDMGCTHLASAFNLIREQKEKYDRIFILSDFECNVGNQAKAYADYIREVTSPYIYSVDLASYGTGALKNKGKVNYYYGYSYAMFDDIALKEFDPAAHIDKIRQIEI